MNKKVRGGDEVPLTHQALAMGEGRIAFLSPSISSSISRVGNSRLIGGTPAILVAMAMNDQIGMGVSATGRADGAQGHIQLDCDPDSDDLIHAGE
jgi:hypothetical protein